MPFRWVYSKVMTNEANAEEIKLPRDAQHKSESGASDRCDYGVGDRVSGDWLGQAFTGTVNATFTDSDKVTLSITTDEFLDTPAGRKIKGIRLPADQCAKRAETSGADQHKPTGPSVPNWIAKAVIVEPDRYGDRATVTPVVEWRATKTQVIVRTSPTGPEQRFYLDSLTKVGRPRYFPQHRTHLAPPDNAEVLGHRRTAAVRAARSRVLDVVTSQRLQDSTTDPAALATKLLALRSAVDQALASLSGLIDSADGGTGILPNAHRCNDCSFTTANAERMDGHLRATGHRPEGA